MRRRNRRRAAHDLLQQLGMQGYQTAMPHTLSGGQLQRVAIARAMVMKPALMLFDEPFCNIDESKRIAIRHSVFGVLQASGVPTVLVTHDCDDYDGTDGRTTIVTRTD